MSTTITIRLKNLTFANLLATLVLLFLSFAPTYIHGQCSIPVTFTAPADLCIDAGVQAGLGGGTPAGGVYSGAGIIDIGDGMTYSFDPAVAGAGVHILTYTYTDIMGCTDSATDNVEVFASPVVGFTAPADLCIDAGVQAGLDGGTPTGGVYSGAGVTDDGNGETYSFDPAIAGVGIHTLTYTYTDANGCSNSVITPNDLIINGGFDSDANNWTPMGVASNGGWQASGGNPGGYFILNASGATGSDPSIEQVVSGFSIGESYTLTGDSRNHFNCCGQFPGQIAFAMDIDGIEVAALPNPGTSWTAFNVTFTATASSHTIRFRAEINGTDTDQALDNLSIKVGDEDVEVFALPVVAFTAPADLCIDAGVQAGLGGATPTGGVYSGAGVTDDGNGMTYSFDPATAGVGTHTITYDYTDANGCSNSASDDVQVFALPVVAFTAPADLCVDAGVQAGLGGAMPTGGVYSGAGVTDDGNGMTYSFDPAAAGVGTHTITYDYTDANGCSNSASDDVQVFALPVVAFTAPADLCVDAGVQAGLDGGTPTGGVYSGAGVTDDGNGETYSFDPATAGVGTHTITYDYTDVNGCSNSASDDIEVFALPIVAFTAPADMCVSAGVQMGLSGGTPTGGVYSGAGVTDDGDGLTYSFDPAIVGVGVQTITYTYTDMNGCIASASDDVEVIDLMFDCPSDTIIQLMPEQCDTIVTFDAPDFTDDCPEADITQIAGLPSGSVFPIGENIISFEGRDDAGNVDTCTWSIIVEEYVPMGLLCKGVVNFSVDEMTCSGSLTPSMLIDVTSVGCADSCTITVTGADGIKRPADFTSADIGKTFDYEICCGGICCWGVVNVEYKFKPVIECVATDTLSCTQSFDESLITPDVSMSCAEVDLITVDRVVEPLSCDTLFTAKMTTRYTAIDEYGNTSDTCTQTIFLRRTNLDSISPVFPFALYNNKALQCGSGFPTTSQGYPFPALSETGAPRLKVENGGFVDLYPFDANKICNGYAEFRDEILDGSTDCVVKIKRTFTIGEWWCSKSIEKEFVQYIEVVDTEGPIVVSPTSITISTSSYTCEGSVSLDLPQVLYDCSQDIRFDLSAPTASVDIIKDYDGSPITLPVGTNGLTYHVYDGCGNRSDAYFEVTVKDLADPIAICDQFTTVGIGLNNLTKVTAESIDDGSFDECSPVTLTVARMDSPGFDELEGFGPDVDITCEDIGNIVMVGLLVEDVSGNTNMCMVSVEVQDKIDAKFETCPGNISVPCNFAFDPDNLDSPFGAPTIYDNCPSVNTIENRLIGSLTICGSGVLTREMRLINPQGEQVDFCTQQITFESGTTLQYSDITPPVSERTVTGCGIESIDPSILGMPIVPDRECQQSAISIENDTFPFTSNGACLKIIRTFKVIDWCIDDGPGSVLDPFVFTQTIKVNNTVGPEIENVFADSVFCSYSVGCVGINVNNYLTATASDDCTASNDLLNRYEVRDSEGKVVRVGVGLDASGYYDVDKYTVRFISEDKCGNQTFEESTFEVRSCKLPTPYCLQGLSTSLTAMDTTGDGTADIEMVMLTPDYFDAGSYHPCGYDVQLSFSSDLTDTVMGFFCSDTVGLQPIELWVTDEFGGQDYCTTFIDIQDNDTIDLCGGMKPVDISGRIYTEVDAELYEAEVELKSSESIITTTDENGMYEFADMPQGGNYQVAPYKDDDHMNGVSTLDLVMIQRHILGIAPLNSAYKMIAADINNNEKISASDLVALRKMILGIENSFPNNTSWRFIDTDFEFANPADPWESAIDEAYNIFGLSDDMQIDFIAVKTGDVNGNVDMNLNAGLNIETRSSSVLTLGMPDIQIEPGQSYKIEVIAKEDFDIKGLQHSMWIKDVNILDILPGKLDIDLNDISIRENQLNVSYASERGDEISVDDVLFTLVIKSEKSGALSEKIGLSNQGLAGEVYIGEELKIGGLSMEWDSRTVSIANEVEMILLGNNPNPWRNSTEIVFNMPEKGSINLQVTDIAGRILVNKTHGYEKGEQRIVLTNRDFPQAGMLFYELRFGNQVAKGKMIHIE